MINDKTESILTEIFGRHSGWSDGEERPGKMCPGFPDIVALADLLGQEPGEEPLQQFLADHPALLFGFFGEGGDSDQGFLTKPPVGTNFNADFAILNTSQGGCSITLVEIEPSREPLFTKALMPAKRLQGALGQINDWAQWITSNKRTFVRDTVDLLKRAPQYPEKAPNKSFRLWEPEHVESSWHAFGGFDDAIVKYAIFIGRWSRLNPEERSRLIFTNRGEIAPATIYTYDQIARRAFDRPVTSSY